MGSLNSDDGPERPLSSSLFSASSPVFISFEGIDGSGKSTQARRLASTLRSQGHTVVEVREPGGTFLAESVRTLLLDPASEITPRSELLLFSAARADLVDRVIRPALDRGDVVIADRFFDSTTAYQGVGRGIAEPAWLDRFHAFVTGGLAPERTYLLALAPEAAEARSGARGGSDRMEASGRAFYVRVSEGYGALAAANPNRFCVMDAMQPPDVVSQAILRDAETLLAQDA